MEATAELVQRLVHHALGGENWTAHRPVEGWSATSYVAERAGSRVFIKLEGAGEILRRVAEIGVAPALLAAGEFEGMPYVVQEFIDGTCPSHSWMSAHAGDVTRLLRQVHDDAILRALLLPPRHRPVRQLRDLPLVGHLVRAGFPDHPGFPSAWERLIHTTPAIRDEDLVPTHGDVSRKNFLVTPARVVVIDWDDVALADPLRDLGPLLWWYVPPPRWETLLVGYGLTPDGAMLDRVFWWAACVSVDVTAGLLERGYREDAVAFLGDFLAAAARQPNPRPRYT